MARNTREFKFLLVLVLLGAVALCVFLVQLDSDQLSLGGPPVWRFSVKLARVRAQPKETRALICAISVAGRRDTCRIPQQLILTSKDGLMSSLPLAVQRNVRHTIALNPWLQVRWFGDDDCQRYLQQHFNHTQLPYFFSQEKRGSYRSDVCRAAVLAREGGFYTDLDVEMKWKFEDLAGNVTSFLASYSEDGSVLNAMMGCTANSSVMKEILQQLLIFYRGEPVERYGTTSEWMGPITALAGLKATAAHACPDADLAPSSSADVFCGSEVFRMFQEKQLMCYWDNDPDCPGSRYTSEFPGVKYGIYVPSGALVAWPRFANCSEWGCSTGGWPSETPTEEVSPLWN